MTGLPIPEATLDQHIAILGKTRSGKSSAMRILIEHLLDAGKPVCIIDPKGDWWGLKSSSDGKKAGYPVVIFGGDHADVPINEHSGAHVAELVATGNRPCIIDLGGWMPGERTRFFVAFASMLFKLTRGLRWLAIDEVHNFCPKAGHLDPEAAKALHWTNRLASEGLGKGVHLIFASQRPQKVHNDTLTSAETLIAMRVGHPADREAISEWIKGCGDTKIGAQVMASLADQKRGEGWVWSPEIGFGPTRIQFPMFTTYDSFKAQPGEAVEKLKGWATVDLDDVRAKLAAVVEEAKANDPRALKAEVASLKAQLRKTPQGASPEQLAAARAEGHTRGLEQGRAESAAEARRLQTAIRRASEALGVPLEAVAPVPARTMAIREIAPRPTPPPRAAPVTNDARDSSLGKAERLILTALAQYLQGRTKAQIALLTGYAVSGGGFNNALGRLRSEGYVEGRGDFITATASGIAALGSYDPLPVGDALLAYWYGQLGKAERAILETVAGAHPDGVDKEGVARQTGYEASGGGFNNALGRLRTLELIERGNPIRASDDLFG